MDNVLENNKLGGGNCQYLETRYPGSSQHELQIKILFNPLAANDYVGIANFPENAQQRTG